MTTGINDTKLVSTALSQLHASNQVKPLQNTNLSHENDSSKIGLSEKSSDQPKDTVELQVSISKHSVDTLKRIGNISEFLNATATSLRQTDEGLKNVSGIIEQMRTTLDKIIKNYPPFTVESQERRDILMSYISIRKEIEQMTVPTPPPPIYEHVKYLWRDLFSSDTPNNVSTPELTQESPDSHIQTAAKSLDALQAKADTLRTDIGSSTGYL